MMTRKDFEMLAQVLRVHRPRPTTMAWELFLVDMTDELQRTNPRFDAVRFREACHA